jgi:hypothetical protein
MLALLALAALHNPGFESGLSDWDVAGEAKGVAIDEGVAHSGKRSLRVSAGRAASGAHQTLRFNPPAAWPLRLSGWSKAAGLEVKGAYIVLLDGRFADGTKMDRQALEFTPGTHDWEFREIRIEADKPLASLEVVPLLADAQGTAWFDDLAVTPVPLVIRNLRTATGWLDKPVLGVLADLTGPARWDVELSGQNGVAGRAKGEGPPVQLHWSGPPGDYTLRISATDFEGAPIGEVRHVSLRPAPGRQYAAWIESSMNRVMPQALPPAAGPLVASVSLAANEYESFQLCLLAAPGEAVRDVRLEPTDLVSASGRRIAASEIEWQQVGFVRVQPLRTHSRDAGLWPGWWPDPLLPVEKFELKPGFTQPVWITVHAPPGTAAGEYSGAIRVVAAGRPTIAIQVRATVYGFELLPVSHLKTAFALADPDLEHLYGRPLPATIRRQFGDFLLRHRLNADDIYRMKPPEIDDLRHFDAHGLQDVNATYLVPPDNTRYEDPTAYTPELLRSFFDRLDPFMAKMREAGMAKRVYLYGFDESPPPVAGAIRDYFSAFKQRYPEVQTMTTSNVPLDPTILADLHVDRAVPLTSVYDYEKADLCRRAGFQVWGYVACGPREPYANFLADDPLVEARVLWWQAYQQKMDGFLYWGVNVWERRGNARPIDPQKGPLLEWSVTTGKPTDEEWRDLHGDGLLVYAGKDGPIGSIRLANIRDGLEDYEYLWLLAQKRGIDAARAACPPVTESLTKFTHDPAVVYRQRESIARRLRGR